MKLIRLLATTIAFLLCLTGLAHADPITGAIAVISGILKAGGIAAALLQTAFSVALSLGVGLLEKARARNRKVENRGIQFEIQMGDDQPVHFPLGFYAVAGLRKYAGAWGSGNTYFVDVIELSSLPISGLAGLWVGDQKATIDYARPDASGFGFPITEFMEGGNDYLWIKFYDGTQTTADPYLLEKFGSHPDRPYKDTMIGRGVAYAVITSRFNTTLFSSAPVCLFEVQGIPVYDLRKDSTAGGSGSHRWADQSTWEASDNPIINAYNVIRGIYYGDDEWVYGGQDLAAFQLPASNIMAAANECDVAMTRSGGAIEKQFRCGYEVRGNMEPLAVVEDLAQSCNGRVAEVGGKFKFLVGSPGAAVYSFTDDQVIITEGQSFAPFPALTDTFNGIEATYPEPKEKWATKDAPARYSSVLEAEDGDRRLASGVSFAAVPYALQVQQLMKAMIEEQRRFRAHNFHLPPDAWALEPNDVVAWTSRRNGYTNKKFLVTAIEGERNFNQPVVLKEIDPTDYGFSGDDELPTDFGWLGPVTPTPTVIDGWDAEPATLTDADGVARRPSIKVLAADALDDVKNVWVQVRLVATGAVVFDNTSIPYAPPYEWILNGTFIGNSPYQARGREVPYSRRKTSWSAWLDVTTPDIRLTSDDLSQEIIDKLEELSDWIDADLLVKVTQAILDIEANADAIELEQGERVTGAIEIAEKYRAILNEIDTIRDYVANADYASYTAREELRRTITVRLEDSIALFDERITTAVSETAAIAERLTTLQADVSDVSAQITTVDTARVDGDEALAQQISLISAGTDNQFDPVKLWNFESTIEGWSGNGTPTVSGGFLRPANEATDPYVASPAALAVSANTYRQVRARIRKYGSPTWEGHLWWYLAADPTWDVSRRETITEPSYDSNNIGLVTFNLDWTGTIDSVRLDLSTAQTGTDYFTIDWIAIGSPSPGASRAELATERTARISGDSANAADIVALEATINDPTTGLTAVAGGVTALVADVTALEGTVTALSTAVTEVDAALDDKADALALAVLSAEVEALGGGGIVSQGSALTAVRNTLLPLASEVVDQDFANFLGKMQGLKVTADASQSLTTRIELTERSIDIVSRAVSVVQAVIPDLAKASALASLDSRVGVTEGLTVAQAEAITRVKADLGWVDGNAQGARAVALTDLQASVTVAYDLADAKSKVYRQASAPTGTTEVPLRTNDLWIDSDDGNKTYRWTGSAWSDVTDSRITANASAITSIKSELDWDDDEPAGGRATAFTSLNTRVDSVIDLADSKSRIFRQSTEPTGTIALPLRTNDIWYDSGDGNKPYRYSTSSGWSEVTDARITAAATLISEVQAEVEDIMADARMKFEVVTGPSGYARVALRARYGTSGSRRSAGLYIDVPSDTGEDTQVLVEADKFAFIDGSSKIVPFRIDDGIVYIDDLRVVTSNIAPNAVTASASMNGNTLGDPADTVALTGLMNNSPALISITGDYSISAGSGSSGNLQISVVNTTTGSTAYSFFQSYGSGNTSGGIDAFRIHSNTDPGTNNYELVITRSGFASVSVDIDVKFLYWRR
jgi:hypothetical protein